MRFIIDGYNLLHRLGLMHGRSGPVALEHARASLLRMIRRAHGEESPSVTVVFDASRETAKTPAETNFQGVQVRFAVEQDEADDLIEMLLRQESVPERLSVVSDDRRIRQAGQRRGCRVLSCDEYLDWMDSRGRPAPHPGSPPAVKPEKLSDEEKQHWLREFGDVEQERGWEELFGTDEA